MVVIAGGLATRMQPLTTHCPKILLNVAGRPFAEHQIELFQQQGIRQVIYCVSHFGEQIVEALGDGSRWGMTFQYVFDRPFAGTGGALFNALPLLKSAFFVTYGDAYLECSLRSIKQAFDASHKFGLMTRYRGVDYGLGILTPGALLLAQAAPPTSLNTIYQCLDEYGTLAYHDLTTRFREIGSKDGLHDLHKYLLGRVPFAAKANRPAHP